MESLNSTLISFPVVAALASASFLMIVAALACFRRSDGPLGPIPGGPLLAGKLIQKPPSGGFEIERAPFAEIETVSTDQSRTTGLMEYEGDLFIPCDLGFIWRRVSPPAKWLMALVWLVKRWHQQVLLDSRVVVRIRGQRYLLNATRVDEPELVAALKSEINGEAEKLLGSRLATRAEDDGEIWFFRLDPR